MKIFSGRNYTLQYTRLLFKKTGKIFARLMISMTAMTVLLAAVMFGVQYSMYHSRVSDPADIYIVMPDNDQGIVKEYTETAASMESVRDVCRFHYSDRETGIGALKEGKCQAVIIFPNDFYKDINDGKNTPVTVMMTDNSALNTGLFRELIRDGVSYIETAEAGIYAAEETAGLTGFKTDTVKLDNVLTDIYMSELFNRTEMVSTATLSAFGDISRFQYYAASVLSAVMMISGISFSFLYKREDRIVCEKLSVYGINRVKSGLCRTIVMAVTMLAVSCVMYGVICAGALCLGIRDICFSVTACLEMFPVLFCMAGVFHLIYSAGGNTYGKNSNVAPLMLIIFMIMFIVCGSIVPPVFLPQNVHCIGNYMPLSFWRRYYADVITGRLSLLSIAAELAGGIAAVIGGAVLCRDI